VGQHKMSAVHSDGKLVRARGMLRKGGDQFSTVRLSRRPSINRNHAVARLGLINRSIARRRDTELSRIFSAAATSGQMTYPRSTPYDRCPLSV
jgi:hypothetical protein